MYFQPSQVTIQLNCNQFNWKITWVATLISITSLYAHFCNWTSSTKWPDCVSISVYHKCHYPINQLECLVCVCMCVSFGWMNLYAFKWGWWGYACSVSCLFLRRRLKRKLQSLRMPLAKHFCSRQNWHLLRWCLVTSQFIAPRHW